MSVCVVALWMLISAKKTGRLENLPKRVTHDKERDVFHIGPMQNLIALCFNHVTISEDQRLFIERFLACPGE